MTADILCRAKRRTVFIPRNGAELRAYAQCEIDLAEKAVTRSLRLYGKASPASLRALEAAIERVRASMEAMLEQDDLQPPGAA